MQTVRTPKQIGEALRHWRKQRRLTQAGLGAMTRQRQALISIIESGAPGTAIGTICEILAALDLELVIQPRAKVSADEIGMTAGSTTPQ